MKSRVGEESALQAFPEQLLDDGLLVLGLRLTSKQTGNLMEFGKILLEGDSRFNLTAITDPAEIIRRHILDSLAVLLIPEVREARMAVDLGSGNGTPGIPLAVAMPGIQFHLIEASRKKSAFLNQCIDCLGLGNVEVETGRAEVLARSSGRVLADLVVSRAFGPLRVILEVGLPFLRVNGTLVAHKSMGIESEINDSIRACDTLQASFSGAWEYAIPGIDQPRCLVQFKKVGPTPPKFPRKWAAILREGPTS